MNTSSSTRLHPLFRPDSFYRLATDDWLWFDGGETAIRRFFEGLRKRQLLAKGDPGVDWGFGTERNAELDESLGLTATHLSGLARTRLTQPSTEKSRAMGAAPGVEARNVHLFDVSSPSGAALGTRNSNGVFGAGGSSQSFSPNIPGVPVGRSCLLLLVSNSNLKLLEILNEKELNSFPRLDAPVPPEWSRFLDRTQESLVSSPGEILKQAILGTMLDPAEPTPENLPQLRRAWWISSVLSESAGVSGISEKAGIGNDFRFRRQISLDRESPPPNVEDYTAVLCIGPESR